MYHLWVVVKGKAGAVLAPMSFEAASGLACKVAGWGKVDRAEVRDMTDGSVVFSAETVNGYVNVNNC